jgi:membrane fusion protein, multidrug efflux system
MPTATLTSKRSFHIVCCTAALTLLAACGKGPEPAGAGGGAPPAMPVAVRSVAQQSVPVLIEAVGQAEGSREIDVRARVGGLIERQLYQEGERVRAGAPLFSIERAPYEIALVQARATLAREQALGEQARREVQRLKPLADMQAIPQREFDEAATTLRLTEATLAAAQARVRDAELNLSYTSVTAPIGGVSGRAEKSVGSLVSPADGLLARITQTDPVWVRFSFSQAEHQRLRSGQAGPVRLLGADGQPLGAAGRLNFAGSTVDARLGTVQLRAEFANPTLAVLPGQFVRAQVQAGQEVAFLVPQAAVVTSEQGRAVWTLQGGKAVATPVETGGWIGADWVVRKGLKDGDQVIIDNLIKLRPGAAVVARADAAPVAAPGAASGPTSAPASAPAPAASR